MLCFQKPSISRLPLMNFREGSIQSRKCPSAKRSPTPIASPSARCRINASLSLAWCLSNYHKCHICTRSWCYLETAGLHKVSDPIQALETPNLLPRNRTFPHHSALGLAPYNENACALIERGETRTGSWKKKTVLHFYLKLREKKKLYLSSLPLEGREQGLRFHSPKGLIWSPGQTANTDPENISEFLSTEGRGYVKPLGRAVPRPVISPSFLKCMPEFIKYETFAFLVFFFLSAFQLQILVHLKFYKFSISLSQKILPEFTPIYIIYA